MTELTITVSDETLRRARMRALERGTTLDAVLCAFLEEYAGATEERERAVAEVLRIARRARTGRGAARWTRDALHD